MKSYVSQNIKILRKKQRMTQLELSEYLFVTHQAVSKWERGESFPDISLIPELAKLFNISISELWKEPISHTDVSFLQQITELSHTSISENLFQGVLDELEMTSTVRDKISSFDFFSYLNEEQKECLVFEIIEKSDSELIIEDFYFHLTSTLKNKLVSHLLTNKRCAALETLIPMMSKSVKTNVLSTLLINNEFLFLEELLPFLDKYQKNIIVVAILNEQIDAQLIEDYLPFFSKKQQQEITKFKED